MSRQKIWCYAFGHEMLDARRLRPGWKILPTRIGYCSNTSYFRPFRPEDNKVDFKHVQPHYCRVRQVEPCCRFGEVAWCSFWAIELLAQRLNSKSNNNNINNTRWRRVSALNETLCVFGRSFANKSSSPTKCVIGWLGDILSEMSSRHVAWQCLSVLSCLQWAVVQSDSTAVTTFFCQLSRFARYFIHIHLKTRRHSESTIREATSISAEFRLLLTFGV